MGGGVLTLAGVASAGTGPSTVIAFALNGVIALPAALRLAELSTRVAKDTNCGIIMINRRG